MQEQTQNQAETDLLLNEIFLVPAAKVIANRFISSAEDASAACGAECNGHCGAM